MLSDIDSTWDFRGADTKTYTHCYHAYPAMMIPQIAARLIARYAGGGGVLFDPYCGSGTSLVEANLQNIDAIGTDLNPLARLLAKTKTARINLARVDAYLARLDVFLFGLNSTTARPMFALPDFHNIDFWFAEEVKNKLAALRYFIEGIEQREVRDFFYIAFSAVVREASFTRNGEFKLLRMPAPQREKFNPDVFGMFVAKLARNRRGLHAYLAQTQNTRVAATVCDFNTVEPIRAINPHSIDVVVTSPPYGDSKTTVAYGQFSRLANQWLGIENAAQVDNALMGGKAQPIAPLGLAIVDASIEKVAAIDAKRGQQVYSFYRDYAASIHSVAKTLKPGGYACYVVGNRRVKGVTLPTDQITQALFAANGFAHTNTFIRTIPNKRMPSKNSPSNQAGQTATTMCREYIVVMQKLC